MKDNRLYDNECMICDESLIEVKTSNVRETDTGVEGGMDVDFEFEGFGVFITDHLTLTKNKYSGNWESWGDLDMWLNAETIECFQKYLDNDELRIAVAEIATETAKAIEYQEVNSR